MKHVYLFLFFWLILVGRMSAQDKDASWRFAAGVTAYSQNSFVEGEHPLEINLKYRVKGNHVLRMGIPIMKRELSPYFSPSDMIYNLQNNLFGMVIFAYNQHKLHGFSLGYEYVYDWKYGLSFSIGADWGNSWLRRSFEILEAYTDKGPYDVFQQIAVRAYDGKMRGSTFFSNVKPFIGVKYHYRHIMGEFTCGYYGSYVRSSPLKGADLVYSWYSKTDESDQCGGEYMPNALQRNKVHNSYANKFTYTFNIYVTF